MNLAEKIYDAGVVGAGGAGFPTHIKAKSQVEYFLANGAECEPLVHKDYELMIGHAAEIVRGVELLMAATKSKHGYFCIKSKNEGAIEAIEKCIVGDNQKMFGLGDFYPSGDEFEVVHSVTGKLIPAGGIPIDIGCLVSNVETCYNIARAENDKPVTEKFVSINGAVNNPCAFFAPIGIALDELIEHAGGTTVDDYSIIISGLMMGALASDGNDVVTKTTAGLIVLPKNHYLVGLKEKSEHQRLKIGRSACDQCRYCTELCPRYLLGYDVQPHQVMRSLGFTKTGASVWNQLAALCSGCGLCTLYACPENLFPKEVCDRAKIDLRKEKISYVQTKPVKKHPLKEARRVPLPQLIKRLHLKQFDVPTPYISEKPHPRLVKVLLKQHIGEPARPIVEEGRPVSAGQVIGEPAAGKLGAKIHASISGVVSKITADYIQIEKRWGRETR